MNIEVMKKEDILGVMEVEKECFSDPWTEKMFLGELASEYTIYLIVKDNGRIIGYGGAWCVAGDADITNIAVMKAYRRRHIGEELLSCLISKLKNAENIRLEVRKSNIGAIALYEKKGFKKIAVRKNYYKDNNEDAFILELKTEEEK